MSTYLWCSFNFFWNSFLAYLYWIRLNSDWRVIWTTSLKNWRLWFMKQFLSLSRTHLNRDNVRIWQVHLYHTWRKLAIMTYIFWNLIFTCVYIRVSLIKYRTILNVPCTVLKIWYTKIYYYCRTKIFGRPNSVY